MTILWTLFENFFSDQSRYNDETYDISMLIYLSSAKTYNLMRNFFHFLQYQNLYEKHWAQIKIEKDYLTDNNPINNVIEKYKNEDGLELNDGNVKLVATLAIDAIAFESFQIKELSPIRNQKPSRREAIIYNNGFLFLLGPIDYHYPPKILYIEKMLNGNYNQKIDEITSNIRKALQNKGFKIWFKATDGDRYLSDSHCDFFTKNVENKSSNFLLLVRNIYIELEKNFDLILPVGDPLHLRASILVIYINQLLCSQIQKQQLTKVIFDYINFLYQYWKSGSEIIQEIKDVKTICNISYLDYESNYYYCTQKYKKATDVSNLLVSTETLENITSDALVKLIFDYGVLIAKEIKNPLSQFLKSAYEKIIPLTDEDEDLKNLEISNT